MYTDCLHGNWNFYLDFYIGFYQKLKSFFMRKWFFDYPVGYPYRIVQKSFPVGKVLRFLIKSHVEIKQSISMLKKTYINIDFYTGFGLFIQKFWILLKILQLYLPEKTFGPPCTCRAYMDKTSRIIASGKSTFKWMIETTCIWYII